MKPKTRTPDKPKIIKKDKSHWNYDYKGEPDDRKEQIDKDGYFYSQDRQFMDRQKYGLNRQGEHGTDF